jgi:hypothetical protein
MDLVILDLCHKCCHLFYKIDLFYNYKIDQTLKDLIYNTPFVLVHKAYTYT